MHRVVWSDEATDHLAAIKNYIEQFDPRAATRIAIGLAQLAASLSSFPERGRPSPRGTREMVAMRPFVVRYIVERDLVVILSIRHSSRLPLD